MDRKSRLLVMGKLYFKNKDYSLAESSFVEYLNSCPDDFQVLKLLAQTYEFKKDYSRAFDAYERCFLAEPERKGVLLDICRLLLMNDSSLDFVNAKKWLNLAIQAFPSNPIVLNLRQSIPSLEQTPNQTSIDVQILEKLTSMERRLQDIENKIENLTLSRSLESKSTSDSSVLSQRQTLTEVPVNQTKALAEVPASQPKQLPDVPVSQPKAFPEVASSQPKVFSEVPSSQSKATSDNSLGQTKVFSSSLLGQTKAFPEVSLNQPKPAEPLFSFPSKPLDGTLFSTLTKSVGSPFQSQPVSSPVTNKDVKVESPQDKTPNMPRFDFAPKSDAFGANLFAQSLQKFDIKNTFGQKKEVEDEDDNSPAKIEELPIEDTCDMKPIEIKSGEEDEDILFKERCKLYRFRDKEYKERGLGDIKVLKHKETGKIRLIMRRELINLVCLNCWSCSKVERLRDTQIRFAGMDASDGEPVMTVFLVKFKTSELADRFESHVKDMAAEE